MWNATAHGGYVQLISHGLVVRLLEVQIRPEVRLAHLGKRPMIVLTRRAPG
jgi:hypothetical protein